MSNYYMEDSRKPSKVAIVVISLLLIVTLYFFATMTYARFTQPQKDVLVIGTNTPFKPFEFKEGQDVTGFDIELGKMIGDKMGRRVFIKDFSDFAAIFPALETGGIDMAISGITITTERQNVASFSDSYYNTSQALLTKKKSNYKFSSSTLSPNDFKGMNLGFQELTTSQSWVDANLDDSILKSNASYPDLNYGLQSLRLPGGFDGILVDESVAITLVQDFPDLTISGIVDTKEQYGVMVKIDDPQSMLPKVNAVIKEMKTNGEYDKLIKKYFGGN